MSDADEGPPEAQREEGDAAQLHDAQSVATAVRDPARLAALRDARLLDTGPEESFDRLTRLAVELLDAPVSLVSLVDEDRQYFKSAVGLQDPWASARQTPLTHSICQQVVAASIIALGGALGFDVTVEGIETEAQLDQIRAVGCPSCVGQGYLFGRPQPAEVLREQLGEARHRAGV